MTKLPNFFDVFLIVAAAFAAVPAGLAFGIYIAYAVFGVDLEAVISALKRRRR